MAEGKKQKYQNLVLPAHYFCLFSLFTSSYRAAIKLAASARCRRRLSSLLAECCGHGGANNMNERVCGCVDLPSHFLPLPIRRSKRAAYKYAKDRGAVASRWCWLATQISELDYKIRQHTDLRKHIRDNKGVVALEEVAGFEGQLPGSKTKDDEEGEGSAARVRPFVKASFRKRKIVLTANLHQVSKKASRPR
jgi:hypothetical protein